MITVPQRFLREIQLHLIHCTWPHTIPDAPLILGIEGPPGDGKTVNAQEAIKSLGWEYIALSTSDFGSSQEAECSKKLRAKYAEASIFSQHRGKPYVLICDDIDAAIGQWGGLTQYTVNTQFITGELMHLCGKNSPMEVETSKLSIDARELIKVSLNDSPVSNVTTIPVPIIFTGNDFTKLYAPLLRAGRMRKFEWIPDEDERIIIIESIFKPHLSSAECFQLYHACQSYAKSIQQADASNVAYKPLPISFFSALKVEVQDDAIISMVEQYKWTVASQLFKQNELGKKSILQMSFSYDICLKKAKERILAQLDKSYL
ncbi:MAG: AAA family ATPase [Oscillospiraceae bacterium]|nr:AAA family ATPase [Oscillospiraceae bacterium]